MRQVGDFASELFNSLSLAAQSRGINDCSITINKRAHFYACTLQYMPKFSIGKGPLNVRQMVILDPQYFNNGIMVEKLEEFERDIRAMFDDIKRKYGSYC